MNISVLGIDIAKNVFQLHGVNSRGKKVYKKRIYRKDLLSEVIALSPKLIVMESCGTSNYWGRELVSLGLKVKLIAPQHVKPFVKTNKTDQADAAAICEAAQRPSMRFVGIKTEEQQSIQFLHREREQDIRSRTQVCNSIRGMLLEYGITVNLGVHNVRNKLSELFMLDELPFPVHFINLLKRRREKLISLDESIFEITKELKVIHKNNDVSQRLAQIPGVGPIIATAIIGSVGDPSVFKCGREFAAWLGLVPRQCSSGEKARSFGISKRGDSYIRKQLVHGARSVLLSCQKKTDRRSLWAKSLLERKHFNQVTVAIANKTARTIWAILSTDNEYSSGPVVICD